MLTARRLHGQVLATFDNGRVEGFLDMRTLEPVDMTEPAMAARIARRLKHFPRRQGVAAGRRRQPLRDIPHNVEVVRQQPPKLAA